MASASCGSPTDVQQESCQVSAVDLTVKHTGDKETCQEECKEDGAFPGTDMKPHIVANEQYRVSANLESFRDKYKKSNMSTHTGEKRHVDGEDEYLHKLYKYVKMQTGEEKLQNTIDRNAYICSERSKVTLLSEHMEMHRASIVSDSCGSPTNVSQESYPVSAVDLTLKQTVDTEICQAGSKEDGAFPGTEVKPNIVANEEYRSRVPANLKSFQEGSKKNDNLTYTSVKPGISGDDKYSSKLYKYAKMQTGEEKLQENTTDRKAYIYSTGGYEASSIALLSEHVEIHTGKEAQKSEQSSVIESVVKHMAKSTGEEKLQENTTDRKTYIYSTGGCEASRIALLSEHVDIHTEEEARKCEQSTTGIIEPLVEHTGDRKLEECNTDRNVYISSEASNIAFLSEHMNLHPEEVPQECDQSTSDTTEHSVKHMAKPTGEKPFVCKECGFRTVTKSRLARHLMVHTGEKPHMCDRCGFRTAEKGKLNQHLKTHTGERVYKCNQCDYSASQTSDLNNHMAKHTGELPYKCKECEYRTVKMSNLAQHMKVHTGEKPYRCDQCDFRTAWKRSFDLHMAKHSGEKPFVCGECGYRTHNRSNIAQHMKVHSGEKAFKCEQCDYCSSLKGNLDRHMAKHTGEKPFVCGECGYRTPYKSSLYRHMQTHINHV